MATLDNPDLSIVILNYNVRDLLLGCLESIFKSKKSSDRWQIIVVDNASTDGSLEAVRERFEIASPSARNDENVIELIASKVNKGFAGGNDLAIPKIKAPVVLFLNPDTVVVGDAINRSLKFLLSNPEIGAVTSKVELPNGRLDYSCHRGFPTPWNAFCYFTGLSKLFPQLALLSGYTATYLSLKEPHSIDCASGTYLLVRKIAGDQIGWWDRDYFWNGEDIEFCFNLKQKGWKIFFYPDAKIIHYKGSSSGLWSTAASEVPHEVRIKSASHASSAMRIFYMKHFYKNYPPILREFILWGITLLEHYRKFKIKAGLKYEP